MDKNRAMEVLDGVMVSDGKVKLSFGRRSLNPTPVFMLAQTGVRHKDWLELVRKALASLGTTTSEAKEYIDRSLKIRVFTQFHSHVSPYIGYLRERWYPGGIKQVPADFELTPVSLANWYMGDGLSSYDRRFRIVAVVTRFSTASFSEEDNEFLIEQLHNLGISATIGHSGKYPHINISQFSVNYLMDIVEPYVVSSYLYKIKRRVIK